MSDNNPDLAAQEVDDDLRRDQLRALWLTYGKYVIALAIIIALSVGGREFYTSLVRSSQEQSSTIFSDANEAAGKEGANVQQIWSDAVDKLDGAYKLLADFRLAQAYAENGDIDKAIAAYDAINKSSDVDESLKDLSLLKAAILQVQNGQYSEAKARFQEISVKGKPLYFSALEQLAYLNYKERDVALALSQFSLLADDAETPSAIKQRADQFRKMLQSASDTTDTIENNDADIEDNGSES